MGFVTLICLIVAAYFFWEALKDKKNASLGNTASIAHRVTETSPASPAANYKNTRGNATPAAGGSHPDNAASRTEQDATQSSSLMRDSANDSNVGDLASAAVAATGVAGVVAAATSSQNASPENAIVTISDPGTGKLVGGNLRFLDGPIGRKDDLTHIDGVGPVIEEGLNSVGIYHYHQIANFTETDIVNIDSELGFPGRVNRENWVGQARKLSSVTLESSVMEASGDQLDMAMPSADEGVFAYGGDTQSVLTDADYTGVWNTDVMIEVQERLKVLNTRISDAPRLQMTRDEYTAIKANEDEALSRDRLLEILERLRDLDQ